MRQHLCGLCSSEQFPSILFKLQKPSLKNKGSISYFILSLLLQKNEAKPRAGK